MVALYAKGLGCVAFSFVEELVGKHGLADVDSAVVDDVYAVDLGTGLL